MIGGLCLFLFGMNIMEQSLERRASGRLRTVLGKLTTGKISGLLTGLGVTAVIMGIRLRRGKQDGRCAYWDAPHKAGQVRHLYRNRVRRWIPDGGKTML